MNVDTIRDFCLSFAEAKENLQWGDDLCFKIRGKIFAIIGLDNSRLCFKCTPESFAELIEREDIHPAPYVGRYKWVMLDRLDAVRWNELQELIQRSYVDGGGESAGQEEKSSLCADEIHKEKEEKSLRVVLVELTRLSAVG